MGCSARTPTGVGGSGVIAASDLVDGVRQQGFQDGEAVLTPPVDPGRLTISVPRATPARPRESAEVGTFSRPYARMASAMPGTS